MKFICGKHTLEAVNHHEAAWRLARVLTTEQHGKKEMIIAVGQVDTRPAKPHFFDYRCLVTPVDGLSNRPITFYFSFKEVSKSQVKEPKPSEAITLPTNLVKYCVTHQHTVAEMMKMLKEVKSNDCDPFVQSDKAWSYAFIFSRPSHTEPIRPLRPFKEPSVARKTK